MRAAPQFLRACFERLRLSRQAPSLLEIVTAGDWPDLDKWRHFLVVYDRLFAPFRGRPVRLLEIGVFEGGSLRLWRRYFGTGSLITAIDSDTSCKRFEAQGIAIEIGDQGDPGFLARVAAKHGPFDIVIDDGSHLVADQLASFRGLVGHVRSLYVIEDTHVAYWQTPDQRDGLFALIRSLVDTMHDWFVVAGTAECFDDDAWAASNRERIAPLRHRLRSIELHDSLIVVALGESPPPRRIRRWHLKPGAG